MRANVPSAFREPFRSVAARIRVANERPVFEPFPAQEIPYTFTQFTQHAQWNAALGHSEVVQYGLRAGDAQIYRTAFGLLSSAGAIQRPFSSLAYPFVAGTPLSEDYRSLSACAGGLFAALNGKVYRRDASAWTQVADFVDPYSGLVPMIRLAALDATSVVAAVVKASSTVHDHCMIYLIENTSIRTWTGNLPKHDSLPLLAAARDADNNLHIYVEDWSKKKPVYIFRSWDGIWGRAKPILPMDALDDESLCRVGYVSTLSSGRVFLTGVLKRKYGPSYCIYMLGPDNFTFGRDLVIREGAGQRYLLVESDGAVWAVGQADVYQTPLTPGIFSELEPTASADLHSFSLEMQTNAASRLALELPASVLVEHPTDLVAGAMLDLDVLANGEAFRLGRFGIDRLRHVQREEGDSFLVDCSSYAIKKLMDWESDTYFDYMGQGESHGDPGDLTKLVRFSGTRYSTAGGGLTLESLNEDGMLYATVPASAGGFIQCRFTSLPSDAMAGIGLNYGEESLAEAARRLGKKVEDVTPSERGRWALLVIASSIKASATSQTMLYLVDYNTLRVGTDEDPAIRSPYRIIHESALDRVHPPNDLLLAMRYQDGQVEMHYARGPDDHKMVKRFDLPVTYGRDLYQHTERENYGRGLIFLRNNTGCQMSFPVMTDSDVVPLYPRKERRLAYGIPLEDRPDKFPLTNGVVQLDSEQIFYQGLAGVDAAGVETKVTAAASPLQWVPGKVVARSADGAATPSGGSYLSFANDRGSRGVTPHRHGNNYLLQSLTPAAGTRLVAVRVWIRKDSFPEDGLTLSVHAGSVATPASAVAMLQKTLASSSVSSSQMKERGWVTFYLNQDVVVASGTTYWLVLKRAKNPTHPSSASYFSAYLLPDSSYSGGGAYLFCEEDDASLSQAGDIAFAAYGRVDDANKEYMFPVVYQAGVGLNSNPAGDYWSGAAPTALQSFWNGCALTIVQGPGMHHCFRIVRSFRLTDSLNDLFVFALERDPGKIFGADTRARAVPAFYGLTRGYAGTLPAAHGNKILAHKPPVDGLVQAKWFEYYTANEDLTLAEVAEQIARKAGVLQVDLGNRHSGTVYARTRGSSLLTGQESVPMLSQNCIVKLNIVPVSVGANDFLGVFFRDADNFPICSVKFGVLTRYQSGYWVGVRYIWFNVYHKALQADGTYLPVEYPILEKELGDAMLGSYRISLYEDHLSLWASGRIVAAVNLEAGRAQYPAVSFLPRRFANVMVDVQNNYGTGTTRVVIPQAGTRVDNFVMDMGKTGAQLLQTLIGEKRVYFREDGAGGLKIYTDRETDPGFRYGRAAALATEETDIGLATRVLLEGGEVVEVSSAGNLKQYGNFFKTFNFREINNLDDAQYFADLVLEDMSLNRERVEIEGAADPALEPTDEIILDLPGGVSRQVVIDAVSHSMHVDEIEASYDMRLSGRFSTPPEPQEE